METKICLLLLVSLFSRVGGFAESFFGPTSVTNRFLVATNEAVIINRAVPPPGFGTAFLLAKTGTNYPIGSFSASLQDVCAVAGPCEVVVTNQTLFFFRRIPTVSIQTILVGPPTQTKTISIPAGATARIFRQMGSVTMGTATITTAAGFSASVQLLAPEEFSGPLDVTFTHLPADSYLLVSYALTQPAAVLQEQGVIAGPTGRFTVAVERSLNLTNWNSSSLHELTDDQKSFYRLRITK